MTTFYFIILLPITISFLAASILTPICIHILKKIGLFDDPKLRKHPGVIHTKPIPRGGGIPLFLGVFITALYFLPINGITISLFIASFISLVVGVLDDKFDISPYIRFVINILSAALVVFNGVGVPFITNPFAPSVLHLDTIALFSFGTITIYLSHIVSLLWIAWVINMLNWSKGVDGQMPGIVAISATVIGLLSLRYTLLDPLSITSAKLSFIIAGSALGFLLFNYYPARIFPGYGATSIYLLLAVASLLSSAKLATAILVMGIPMVDGLFTIIRRIVSGRSPFWHDKKHLHHLLLELGLSQKHIALFYWSISAILGALSLTLSSSGKFFAIVMLGVLVGGTLLFLHVALRKNS
ncbi:MAG: hypothetical protein A3F31_01205 [Candidatus Levybacteria bacterium RIFCSPHIGHO2_12_FULL_38_12]|nr:MAG: hypothetical protein A2770_01725 [Candidatus Levybacteria bacterium RIFCSPHIGHO2_01_FULL_38_12]OGH22016.1 MAG: hypothetical protein A3D75_03255 [Candidatus Levybacteria bacterium RIFCSPHIGHO2_02_FULL_37_18]OGH23266.1 MAG: hypothetical protein A3F31_01205 [Candidatus Levybacteria bacterium RIFCSPHIGHO2_12_FULL_38_12]OGH33709.1 MAG: hypothetical protein A3A47_02690 [Candidatus Levybacteria bacterium RIFCSPLOWO2_01_FULL_37_20]OGH44615.1 MAG: hypothetical protein A3J14_00775 [Candidatus Lev